jgi:hypothetical protein
MRAGSTRACLDPDDGTATLHHLDGCYLAFATDSAGGGRSS